MPKKKAQINGFSVYMNELMPQLRREGRVFPNGMQDLVTIARPRWKMMSDEERDRYDRMAKEQRRHKQQSSNTDKTRLDNQGNVIAFRIDEDNEEAKRRNRDRKMARSRWPEDLEGIMNYPFYFVGFEYLCEMENKDYLPCEVSVIEYTIEEGIKKIFHCFIEPGGIPLGYRFTCQNHSEETHQIPIEGFNLANDDYFSIWNQIENFVNPSQTRDEYPPLYCFCGGDSKNYKMVDYCMRWLHVNACTGKPNTLQKIYVLEDMVVDIYANYTETPVSVTSIQDMLSTSAFDYEKNSRCKFHEEKEVKYCALGQIKRYAYALSDALSAILDFDLTPNHLPTQDDSAATYSLIQPSAIHLDAGSATRGRKGLASGGANRLAANLGPYSSRDIRYSQNGRAEEEDEEEEEKEDGVRVITGTSSQQAAWGHQTQKPVLSMPGPAEGPWAKTAIANEQPAPGLTSEEDFPSLGGAPSKFAGRAMAPSPAELPRPMGWQDQPQMQQRLPNTMPFAAMATASANHAPVTNVPMATGAASKAAAEAAQKKTLSQAVASSQKQQQTKPATMATQPGVGRGFRPQGAARSVNVAGGFRLGSTGPPSQPAPAKSAWGSPRAAQGSPGGSPSINEGLTKMTLAEAASKQQQKQGGPVVPSSAMSVASCDDTDAQSVTSQKESSLPLAGFGRGRGRGVPRQAGGGPGMRAPPGVNSNTTRPPPGFGRGFRS